MRIIVCIKQILDVRTPLIVDRRKGTVSAPGTFPIINPVDIAALEAAMKFKESSPATEVVALSIGPADAESALRYCLARGVDVALRFWDEKIAAGDSYAAAGVIVHVARKFPCSLLFCGQMSEDARASTTPALVAERLDWPWVNRVVQVEAPQNENEVQVLQRGERGSRLAISCSTPALLAIDPTLAFHQYVSIRRLQQAERKPIQVLNLDQLGLGTSERESLESPMKVVKVRAPKPRTKRTATVSSQMSGEDMMWQMIAGSSSKTEKGNLVQGKPAELAGRILEFLSERGIRETAQKEPGKKESLLTP